MTTAARRSVGAILFALACGSSLAARTPAAARVGGEGQGFDALLGFAAFVLACAGLVLLLLRKIGPAR